MLTLEIYLEIKEFTGNLYESHVAIEYLPWKHSGFGFCFNTLDLNITADSKNYPQIDFTCELVLKYTGLLLYTKIFSRNILPFSGYSY
jgi:hypothetical protein